MTNKKQISPALFATVVIVPVAVLQVVIYCVSARLLSWDLLSIAVIYAISWLVVFFIWRQAGRRVS
ncbi:hypothetical protein [Rathayibacter toxicus]|uniref:Uncharacterized protein n=1 Tax=Rathayibacter toxicus TaxID=145458 RepID=A0A0C5BBC8_9MICO|nr:hypothetical protein [Rathayibacter toxicus]AJM78213.1 hypothetical protein TI83_10305 [Rathayibacter toxicus]ALS57503.1 hypothetical protein APU90_06760 [Rathayibacter toxicus]KKM46793.1 hypothetical protein VT73_01945 [Rathayibacter toxicus]PPG20826.1 hypothetical protein C5D15_10160 [Rathayibacter toxicus]PPG45930.1 hypothetical protein C5D16_10130 [Rathayibacter toxicus]